MFVELLEKLRCPNEHEPSPLIATASRTENRHIIEGTLGCPVCHAEFEIREGAMTLGGPEIMYSITAEAFDEEHSEERMTRMAAQLGLDERGGLYVLDDTGSYFAADFLGFSPNSQFIGATAYRGMHPELAGVFAGLKDAFPLAPGCTRGIVLSWAATPQLLRSAVKVLAPGGRLVAPRSERPPAGIKVLARDNRDWVGERELTPEVASIGRANR